MKRSERIERWLEALESGEYKQCKDELWNHDEEKPRYCCLGVVCVLEGVNIERDTDGFSLSSKTQRLLGIDDNGSFKNKITYRGKPYLSLSHLNDSGVKFKSIAKIIREQLAQKNFAKP
jgi:hypothetical protein